MGECDFSQNIHDMNQSEFLGMRVFKMRWCSGWGGAQDGVVLTCMNSKADVSMVRTHTILVIGLV